MQSTNNSIQKLHTNSCIQLSIPHQYLQWGPITFYWLSTPIKIYQSSLIQYLTYQTRNGKNIQQSYYLCSPLDIGCYINVRIEQQRNNQNIILEQLKYGPVQIEDSLINNAQNREWRNVQVLLNKNMRNQAKISIKSKQFTTSNNNSQKCEQLKITIKINNFQFVININETISKSLLSSFQKQSFFKLFDSQPNTIGIYINHQMDQFMEKLKNIGIYYHFGNYLKIFFSNRSCRDIFLLNVLSYVEINCDGMGMKQFKRQMYELQNSMISQQTEKSKVQSDKSKTLPKTPPKFPKISSTIRKSQIVGHQFLSHSQHQNEHTPTQQKIQQDILQDIYNILYTPITKIQRSSLHPQNISQKVDDKNNDSPFCLASSVNFMNGTLNQEQSYHIQSTNSNSNLSPGAGNHNNVYNFNTYHANFNEKQKQKQRNNVLLNNLQIQKQDGNKKLNMTIDQNTQAKKYLINQNLNQNQTLTFTRSGQNRRTIFKKSSGQTLPQFPKRQKSSQKILQNINYCNNQIRQIQLLDKINQLTRLNDELIQQNYRLRHENQKLKTDETRNKKIQQLNKMVEIKAMVQMMAKRLQILEQNPNLLSGNININQSLQHYHQINNKQIDNKFMIQNNMYRATHSKTIWSPRTHEQLVKNKKQKNSQQIPATNTQTNTQNILHSTQQKQQLGLLRQRSIPQIAIQVKNQQSNIRYLESNSNINTNNPRSLKQCASTGKLTGAFNSDKRIQTHKRIKQKQEQGFNPIPNFLPLNKQLSLRKQESKEIRINAQQALEGARTPPTTNNYSKIQNQGKIPQKTDFRNVFRH